MASTMDKAKRDAARWGAACAPCAAAKAKCLRTNSESAGAKCDRCERLSKDCTSQIHRPRKKRAVKPSKTAQLEQRLNGLVNLLRASGELRELPDADSLTSLEVRSTIEETSCLTQDSDLHVSVGAPQARSSQKRRASSSVETDGDGSPDLPGDGPITIPKYYNSYAPESCICRPPTGEAHGPVESDDTVLSIYQSHLSPLFPFVIIPPGTTPDELEMARPFLFSAIRMVTTLTSMRSMRAQMYKLVEYASEHVLLRSERSLDLLQGLIVMMGWYHYHCLMHAQMNNLLHLATSLAADLGLNRHPKLQERTSLMVLYPDEPPPRTNEERRALLGVWFLTSCISLAFGRIDSMKFSPYIQQCLRELQESKEYETDTILATMVQLQHLTEKIAEVNNTRDDLPHVLGIPRAPVSAYISTFQSELDKIKGSLSKSLRNNKYLMVYINSATMRLYEPPVIDAALLTKFQRDLTSLNDSAPSALDIVYRASKAVQDWFTHWLTIPVSSYFYLPMPVCSQLIHAVTMLARWAKLVSPVKPLPPQHTAQAPLADPSAGWVVRQPTIPISAAERAVSRVCGTGFAPPPNFDDLPTDQASSSSTATTSASTAGTTPSSGNISSSSTLTEVPTTRSAAEGCVRANPMSSIRWRETSDPQVPGVIAALKEQLNSQPGLKIDVADILTQLGARCQQANQEMMRASGGEPDSNIWDLSAKKVMITRAKLERWAEIVTQGGGGATLCHRVNDCGASGQGQSHEQSLPGQGATAAGNAGGSAGGEGLTTLDAGMSCMADGGMSCMADAGMGDGWDATLGNGWDCSNFWSADIDGLDPALWDLAADWGESTGFDFSTVRNNVSL
ncbi:hypothetical protein QBC46DRAFT_371581 [Diplogelasinospora grovesii]|uniref:Zn(2)-C6 fungal-type domain-containing protein n=1 Tax=Diplogelasinospora grovesii TaxID=303347 RepID=A0AAN6NHJ1_9PEZI|nr:hypothetical protein QBC46DRAFT_371581 [Diplogelasinospora grovesii]